MQKKELSITLAINDAWQSFKRQPRFFILSSVPFFVIGIISFSVNTEKYAEKDLSLGMSLLFLIIIFAVIFYSLHLSKISLTSIREQRKVSIYDRLKEPLKVFGTLVILGIVIFLIFSILIVGVGIPVSLLIIVLAKTKAMIITPVIAGTLAIIGYILLYTTFAFIHLVAIDNYKSKIKDIIKYCFRLTKGIRIKILGLLIILSILSTLGMITFFIGSIVTIPLSFLIMASAYEQLKRQTALIENKNFQNNNNQANNFREQNSL